MRNMALTVILYFLVMFVQECWYRLAAHFPRKNHTSGEQRASPGVVPAWHPLGTRSGLGAPVTSVGYGSIRSLSEIS